MIDAAITGTYCATDEKKGEKKLSSVCVCVCACVCVCVCACVCVCKLLMNQLKVVSVIQHTLHRANERTNEKATWMLWNTPEFFTVSLFTKENSNCVNFKGFSINKAYQVQHNNYWPGLDIRWLHIAILISLNTDFFLKQESQSSHVQKLLHFQTYMYMYH
jgi:hypothetical protein